jgi:hypothetical protein
MRTRIVSASILSILLGAFSMLSGCAGCPRARGLTPDIAGRAVFVDLDSKRVAWIYLRANHHFDGDEGDSCAVTRVQVFGTPGRKDNSQFVAPMTPLLDSTTLPREWGVDGLETPWDGSDQFTVLVRYMYDVTKNGTTTSRVADQLGHYNWVRPTKIINIGQLKTGDAGSTVAASGTFSATQGIAWYDVVVTYDSNQVSSIQAWAAPAGTPLPDSHYRLLIPSTPPFPGVTNPPSTLTWSNRLTGRYVLDSDQYDIRVQVNYSDGTPPAVFIGTFTGIKTSEGVAIPMDS